MINWIKTRVKEAYNSWKARHAQAYAIDIIAKAFEVSHATELSTTPIELKPQVRLRQAQEILDIHAGKTSIVDRRSWQWPYMPEAVSRIRQPVVKLSSGNSRRFAKTPIARRAINLIKNGVCSLEWDVIPINGTVEDADDETKQQIAAVKNCFNHPNNQDSYQSFMEIGLDDMLINGAFCVEPQLTPDPARPFKMWNVDSATIRVFPTWRESVSDTEPHYAQMTGLKGERGIIVFYDDELLYIRDNPSVDSPFGLAKLEVAFQSLGHFLGIQEMSGRAGADQVHKTWLWWPSAVPPGQTDIIRRHLTNDLEGQSKINIVSGFQKPEVLEVQPTTEEDMCLNWQQLLIRMIGNAFDMSAMALNLEQDVNRAVGEVLNDRDFRSSVVPIAKKLEVAFTRSLLHKKLGLTNLEFSFVNLDDPDVSTKITMAQQLYAMNANTPNEVRVSLGQKKLATPWADMTQIECVVANAEVTAKLAQQGQQAMAKTQFDNQNSMMDKQFAQQQYAMENQSDDDDEGEDAEDQAASAAPKIVAPKLPGIKPPKPSTIPAIKAPKLPTGPIAGSIYSASQIAKMSVAEFKAAQDSGNIPQDPNQVTQQMQIQQPGILQQMSDELREYLESMQEAQKDKEDSEEVKITPQQLKMQKQKYKQNLHKPSALETDVYNVDQNGKPKTGGQEIPTALGYKSPYPVKSRKPKKGQ